MRALGVDGCKGGWIAVRRHSAGADIEVFRRNAFRDLLALIPAPAVVAVDVPIGLPKVGARLCDTEARRLLGRRRSSVFPAPLRAVLGSRSQPEASALRESVEGKRMSLQAFGILGKVAEVDGLLRAESPCRKTVREVHPELCFFFLNGRRSLLYSKRTREGREERLALLRSSFGAEADRALNHRLELQCNADDILDALAGLWTAERILRGEAVTIPVDPPCDDQGLPMRMEA